MKACLVVLIALVSVAHALQCGCAQSARLNVGDSLQVTGGGREYISGNSGAYKKFGRAHLHEVVVTAQDVPQVFSLIPAPSTSLDLDTSRGYVGVGGCPQMPDDAREPVLGITFTPSFNAWHAILDAPGTYYIGYRLEDEGDATAMLQQPAFVNLTGFEGAVSRSLTFPQAALFKLTGNSTTLVRMSINPNSNQAFAYFVRDGSLIDPTLQSDSFTREYVSCGAGTYYLLVQGKKVTTGTQPVVQASVNGRLESIFPTTVQDTNSFLVGGGAIATFLKLNSANFADPFGYRIRVQAASMSPSNTMVFSQIDGKCPLPREINTDLKEVVSPSGGGQYIANGVFRSPSPNDLIVIYTGGVSAQTYNVTLIPPGLLVDGAVAMPLSNQLLTYRLPAVTSDTGLSVSYTSTSWTTSDSTAPELRLFTEDTLNNLNYPYKEVLTGKPETWRYVVARAGKPAILVVALGSSAKAGGLITLRVNTGATACGPAPMSALCKTVGTVPLGSGGNEFYIALLSVAATGDCLGKFGTYVCSVSYPPCDANGATNKVCRGVCDAVLLPGASCSVDTSTGNTKPGVCGYFAGNTASPDSVCAPAGATQCALTPGAATHIQPALITIFLLALAILFLGSI